jgi:hypothetical protein
MYKRGRSHDEEIWVELIDQLEQSSLAVVRTALISSNLEMLLREDMPVSITSRLLDVLTVKSVRESISSSIILCFYRMSLF